MERVIGYVVVEFNQASGQPSTDGDFFQDQDEAEDVAELYRSQASYRGRRERFAVGTVTVEEEDL